MTCHTQQCEAISIYVRYIKYVYVALHRARGWNVYWARTQNMLLCILPIAPAGAFICFRVTRLTHSWLF